MSSDLRGDLDWRMPSTSQNVSVDLVELSSDDEDSSQTRRPCMEPVKKENWGSLSTCKLEPIECIINCQSPPIVASDLRDILDQDMTQNSEYISQQLPLVASQEVSMNLTGMTNGFNASVPGLCLSQSGSCVANADSKVSQNGGKQIENSSRISSSGHDSLGGHAQPNFCNFWKAGDYNAFSNPEISSAKGKMEHVRIHPKFLHSNATSHKWAFGAIAELLDNAVDEIQNGATFIKVEKIHNERDNSPALLFHDNGGGMDPECMRQCMSLGYSSKKSSRTIGQYGNGFKTSTMRLGADTIVFSRTSCRGVLTESIGLLSYTFLRKTGQDDVIVPLVDFEISNGHARPMIHSSIDDWKENMNILLQWSPFSTEEELMRQFEDVGVQGTKIIIFNLWLNDDGVLELDFDNDKEDIRLQNPSVSEAPSSLSTERVESHISYRFRHSLREYASILYLRKFSNFQIILRGRPVEQHNITDDLKFSEVITYKPQLGFRAKEVSVAITVGFIKEAPIIGVHGFNVYHRNRLIMPFWRVIQSNNSCGRGIVGLLEANFMEPAHDKQDFERTAVFIRLECKLKQVLNDYWKRQCHLVGYKTHIHNASVENRHGRSLSVQSVVGLAAPDVAKSFQLKPYPQKVTQTETDADFHQRQKHEMAVAVSSSLSDTSASIRNGRTAAGQEPAGAVALLDGTDSISVDRICEENIQLFMRCEQHRQRETDLKHKIDRLERDLTEVRRKCFLLLSDMEAQGH